MKKKIGSKKDESPAQLIDARIEELNDWRGEMLSRLRALIKQADPAVVEEWKWRGVPVWSHDGLICTGESRPPPRNPQAWQRGWSSHWLRPFAFAP